MINRFFRTICLLSLLLFAIPVLAQSFAITSITPDVNDDGILMQNEFSRIHIIGIGLDTVNNVTLERVETGETCVMPIAGQSVVNVTADTTLCTFYPSEGTYVVTVEGSEYLSISQFNDSSGYRPVSQFNESSEYQHSEQFTLTQDDTPSDRYYIGE